MRHVRCLSGEGAKALCGKKVEETSLETVTAFPSRLLRDVRKRAKNQMWAVESGKGGK